MVDITSGCTGNNFSTGISTDGDNVCAQPAFSNLSGSATDAQIPNDITITETDPQVGTQTNTKWCTSNGTVINCEENAPSGTGDVTDVFNCASGDCSSIATTDGDFLDLSAINASSETEGFKLPQATSVTSADADGQISWDSDGDYLVVGSGSDTYTTIQRSDFEYNTNKLCSATITADGSQSLTLTNCDAYSLNSDNATSTSRTFCIPAASEGRKIVLFHDAGATNEIELADGAQPCASHPSTAIAGVWPAGTNQQDDVITLVYRNGVWREVGRAAN